MNTVHRPARTTRSTVSSRVRPHLRRRNGVVEAPAEHTPRSPHEIAVSYGWRPIG